MSNVLWVLFIIIVHKVLTLTAKKRDQRDYKNSDKNRLVKIEVTARVKNIVTARAFVAASV